MKNKSKMKLLSFVAVLLLAAAVKGNPEMMAKIMMDCQATVGAVAEDIGVLMAHKVPENQKQKCLFGCVLTTLNMVSLLFSCLKLLETNFSAHIRFKLENLVKVDSRQQLNPCLETIPRRINKLLRSLQSAAR